MNTRRPVKRLSPDVARKIAAGEVIDRPCAVVRELMDNAIDSMATEIHVEVESGGIEKIRIFDNGSGMTKEDLENCAHPHATSKIESEADLLNLSTLGFRGEALSSIAAVSRLSIISGSWKMNANISGKHTIRAHANVKGTIVQVEGLFENFPARRNFLKRASAELNACKSMFIEKALSHPNITFTFTSDGEQKLNLLGNTTLRHRFAEAAFPLENESLFYQIKCNKYEDFQFSIIIGEPAISRTSKKDIFIFVNGRKINEYSLVQAIEYGAKGYFPNGTYPVASLFATVKPELVDFNIHPAKREARFQNIAELHHA
ncbi:MAG: DNA mismatch repair endonuclease MutL, partial [Treponema sp.]|nr:DNA mismatch repair endonuclease MutL [Treponema sp.]